MSVKRALAVSKQVRGNGTGKSLRKKFTKGGL